MVISADTVLSQASAHGRSSIPPCFSLYWALIMCKIEMQLVGVIKGTITIAIAAQSR